MGLIVNSGIKTPDARIPLVVSFLVTKQTQGTNREDLKGDLYIV
jgi:hypothetical protein